MGDFIVTYGPNKVRRGNQNNIELQVVAKGGGFAYQLRPDLFDLSS